MAYSQHRDVLKYERLAPLWGRRVVHIEAKWTNQSVTKER